MTTDLTRGVRSSSAGLSLLAELEESGAITATGLRLTDPDMPFERYAALMRLFGHVKGVASWLLGDGLNWGEAVYGDRYVDAAEQTGLST